MWIICLGTPLGHTDFIRARGIERMEKEQRLLDQIVLMDDLQVVWTLLLHCAVS